MKNPLGKDGEERAIAFLKENDYRILATNWRSGHYEIDIIAKELDTLVIIEVKTRSSDTFGHPGEFVKSKKHNNLFRATEDYIEQHNHSGEVRFDIIAVYLENKEWQTEHFKDAFYPG